MCSPWARSEVSSPRGLYSRALLPLSVSEHSWVCKFWYKTFVCENARQSLECWSAWETSLWIGRTMFWCFKFMVSVRLSSSFAVSLAHTWWIEERILTYCRYRLECCKYQSRLMMILQCFYFVKTMWRTETKINNHIIYFIVAHILLQSVEDIFKALC